MSKAMSPHEHTITERILSIGRAPCISDAKLGAYASQWSARLRREGSAQTHLLGALHLACDVDHAEEVVIGVCQHDAIVTRALSPRVPSRPERDQPLHFVRLVVRIEVEVPSPVAS